MKNDLTCEVVLIFLLIHLIIQLYLFSADTAFLLSFALETYDLRQS